MKTTKILYSLLAVTTLLIACSRNGGEFTGKWKPVNTTLLPSSFILTIEKNKDNFIMTNSESPDKPIVITYLEKENSLIGAINGTDVTISYADSTGNLLMKPDANADPIEFEKIK